LFTISGLRGIVGEDLFPETVARVAAAFGSTVGQGPVVLGRDARLSSEALYSAAAAGLASAGCEVVLLGVCPTPTVVHHVRTTRTSGGIVITASHNPEGWNGMKFVSREAMFISGSEVSALKKLVGSGFSRPDATQLKPFRTDTHAVVIHVNAISGSELFDGVREKLTGRKLRVGIDAVNGAASVAAARLVSAFGAEPVELFCRTDPDSTRRGFPRGPEPTAQNLSELCRIVRETKLDLGLAFDPDGDRFSCVDETGFALGEEATICLACQFVLQRRKGPVVVNLSTTRAVEDVCWHFNVPVERTAVGEAAVVEKMRKINAVVGGEGNGGVVVPELNTTRDGLVAAAAVFGLLAETGKKLSEIRLGLPEYHMVKARLEIDRKAFEAGLDRLAAGFSDARQKRGDGLRLEGPDWWLHVRQSNTEPIVRVVAEAKAAEQAAALIERVKAVYAAPSPPETPQPETGKQ
ncbi:MAG: hypothetical protein ABIK37_05220, partial [candidate division WOR-3 bacterium]